MICFVPQLNAGFREDSQGPAISHARDAAGRVYLINELAEGFPRRFALLNFPIAHGVVDEFGKPPQPLADICLSVVSGRRPSGKFSHQVFRLAQRQLG